MKNVFFMCDLLTHPVHSKPTNHEWVVDFWLNKNAYNITKASEIITEQSVIWPYLATEPYSNLNQKQISHIASYLEKTLCDYDVVIAFECKEQTREIINRMHNTIIYSFFSPLRYADRLSFTFTSNNTTIQQRIETVYSKAIDYYRNQAIYVKNLINNKYDPLNIRKETTLLIGQVEEDLAVWNGKKYLNLDNFEEAIFDLTKNTNTLYKAHPFSRTNNRKIQSKENISSIDDEIYRLLASESIKQVITVSSSVAKEAEFFGKKVIQFFSGYITEKAKSIPYTQDSLFWKFLFNENNTTIPHLKIDPIDIRPIRNTYWGYHHIWNIELSELQLITQLRQQIDVLEHKLQDSNQQQQKLDQQINDLEQKLDQQINTLEQKLDQQTNALEQNLNQQTNALEQDLNQQTDTLEQKLDQRTDTLEQKLDQQTDTINQKINRFKRRYFLIRKPRFIRKK